MTDEEKEKFYVNLTLTYTGREYYEEDYKERPQRVEAIVSIAGKG